MHTNTHGRQMTPELVIYATIYSTLTVSEAAQLISSALEHADTHTHTNTFYHTNSIPIQGLSAQ